MSDAASQPETGPQTVVDPATGRPILMAPQRQGRPMHTAPGARADRCPFCEGHEQDTPPEYDAVRRDGSDADGPGWRARAFANKYPAAIHHEVVAEGAEHREHPADLSPGELVDAVTLWRRRMQAIETDPDVALAYWFKNVGARAGASIAHNHSQLIGLAELPPRLQLEMAQQRRLGHCVVCATREHAEREGRQLFASDAFVALVPDPPKLPYESWLLPRACQSDFFAADVDALADALHRWIGAVAKALDRPALNVWLHRVPAARLPADETFHWHFELQPRTGQVAGLELGGDMYINSVPAASAAARLRDGLAD